MIRVLLDGLVKRYESVAVVDGVTLEIPPGELTCLLGPFGAGKSTIARLIAGLDSPDDGEIFFDERAVRHVPPVQRKVGLISEDEPLWPHLSIEENVAFGLKARGVRRSQRRLRVADALALVRSEALLKMSAAALTPLQCRRVAIARALAIEPELLVLDQPFSGLDPGSRSEIRDEIIRLHSLHEVAMLLLCEDPREALSSAERLAILDLGRIVQVGRPSDVYNQPTDRFVAEFLGPANILQGTLEAWEQNGEALVRTPIGRLLAGPWTGPRPSPGSTVNLLIRPESIAVGSFVAPGSNRFAATIERQEYLGEIRCVYLRGPNNWPIQSLTLQSQSHDLREGQAVTISVPPALVRLLRNRPSTGSSTRVFSPASPGQEHPSPANQPK